MALRHTVKTSCSAGGACCTQALPSWHHGLVSSCPQAAYLYGHSDQACLRQRLPALWACDADAHGVHGAPSNCVGKLQCHGSNISCLSHNVSLCDWQRWPHDALCELGHLVQRCWRSRAACWRSSSIVSSSSRSGACVSGHHLPVLAGTTKVAGALLQAIRLLPCSLSEGLRCILGRWLPALLVGGCLLLYARCCLTPDPSCPAASVNSSIDNATTSEGTASLLLPEIAPAPVSQDLLPPLTSQDILSGTLVFIIQLSGGGDNVTADQVRGGSQSSCTSAAMRGTVQVLLLHTAPGLLRQHTRCTASGTGQHPGCFHRSQAAAARLAAVCHPTAFMYICTDHQLPHTCLQAAEFLSYTLETLIPHVNSTTLHLLDFSPVATPEASSTQSSSGRRLLSSSCEDHVQSLEPPEGSVIGGAALAAAHRAAVARMRVQNGALAQLAPALEVGPHTGIAVQ